MSTIYSFVESESIITASNTSTGTSGATLLSSDALIVYNSGIGGAGKTNQTSVGSVSGLKRFESITTSTAAGFLTLAPIGISVITAAATGGVAIMPAPPGAGLEKFIALSATSTTTAFEVICGSSAVAIFTTGTSTNTIVPRLQIYFGQNSAYVDLISISTSAWMVTGQSIGAGAIAFTTTTAT